MSKFSERLCELMAERKTSQAKVAFAAGVTRQSISQYMNGISEPPATKVCRIAAYLGVTTDYLLGYELGEGETWETKKTLNIIKELRLERDLTQRELASLVGTKRENVNAWEMNIREIPTRHLLRLADIFEVSTDFLLGREKTL